MPLFVKCRSRLKPKILESFDKLTASIPRWRCLRAKRLEAASTPEKECAMRIMRKSLPGIVQLRMCNATSTTRCSLWMASSIKPNWTEIMTGWSTRLRLLGYGGNMYLAKSGGSLTYRRVFQEARYLSREVSLSTELAHQFGPTSRMDRFALTT